MKKLLLLVLLSSTTLLCRAQSWHELIEQGETDFRTIQKAFYDEWKGRNIERGNGYMQFKRWEELNQLRLTPDGQITNIGEAYFIKKRLDRQQKLSKGEHEEHSWTPLGPYNWENGSSGYNPGNGRINCIYAVGDELNTVYIGAPAGGLWKQTNESDGWELVTEELSVVGVTDIYVDPDDDDHLLILTGDAYNSLVYSIGILESTDGGATWEETGLTHEYNSSILYYKMEVLPSNPDIIIVAGTGGIKRSEDGGATWTAVIEYLPIYDLAVHPDNDDIIYAASSGGAVSEVRYFKSIDGGVTWEEKSALLPEDSESSGRTALAVTKSAPDDVYLLASNILGGFAGLYRSGDAGETFELRANSPNIIGPEPDKDTGQGWYDLTIAVNPENADEVYVGGFYTYKSTNGGKDFTRLHEWQYGQDSDLPYMHPDIHTLDFYNGQLYAGTDGGIYTTTDDGQTWDDLSRGLGITMFYRLGQDPHDATVVIGGTQDNGSNILKDGQWLHILGSDGMETLIDYEDSDIVYSSKQFGSIFRFDRQGASVSKQIAGLGITERGGWVTPYMLDPIDHETIYAGYSKLYKSEDQGDTWTTFSVPISTNVIADFDIATEDPSYIYLTDGFLMFRTENGGEEWVEITQGLPNTIISKVEISENDPEAIWVTIGGFLDGEKVYRSTDKGNTWENYSEGLPNVATYCIVHQEDSNDQLYIGTDIGVFQRNLDMDSWEYYSNDLPGVITRELEIHNGARKIRAATFGRGMWETSLIESTATPILLDEIAVSQRNIQEGIGVIYTATTTGDIRNYLWEFEGGNPATSTDLMPFVIYEEPGEFDTRLTIKSAVESRSVTVEKMVTVSKITSVDEEEVFFNIYPNPADNQLTVSLGNPASDVTYQLITSEGKSILSKEIEGITSNLSIDLKNLPEGIYFLQLQADDQQVSRKIVISR